jgi:hypothetical protein
MHVDTYFLELEYFNYDNVKFLKNNFLLFKSFEIYLFAHVYKMYFVFVTW